MRRMRTMAVRAHSGWRWPERCAKAIRPMDEAHEDDGGTRTQRLALARTLRKSNPTDGRIDRQSGWDMLDTIPHGKTREDGALFKSNPTDYLTYRQSGWDMLGTMPHRKMGHRGRRTREGEGSGGEGGRGLPGPDGLPALEGRQCLRSAVEARPAQSSVQQTVGSEFACTAPRGGGGGGGGGGGEGSVGRSEGAAPPATLLRRANHAITRG
ncbi:unnamed protein product [Prorocentrum cordatum]|uniref:Uncharacterized protein n=1 Tax=Prorocentrum cordatum TaxID=2364126 RepID=A0ABN9V488_9DINO|nr:unnamed protein product [Polarella glacialis]